MLWTNGNNSNNKRAEKRKWKSHTMRWREKKYVAIYLLCTANSRKMRIDENKLLARTETNSILGMTMLMTMTETIQSLANVEREREKKKLIVFIVSSNLLMDKIGASKENQIKKVVVQVRSFHRRMVFFWLRCWCRSSNKRISEYASLSPWPSHSLSLPFSVCNFDS